MKLPFQNYLDILTNNEDYKRITGNIISLFSLQGVNYLLPLITFPYLTRVLGPEKYGLIAFAAAFIVYFQILTDYGFNYSATREISINRDNNEKLSKIFSSVLSAKFLLMILSFILMSMVIFSFDKFKTHWELYYFTFGLVIGNLLLSPWFFQGMEKLRYISLLNIIAGLIFTISIFIFIRESSDFIYVPLINSIGSIIVGILSMKIILKDFNVKLVLPSLRDIKIQLKEGWHIFISTVAISFYTTSNVFILGLFASTVVVGYYSVAEKIVYMALGLINPVSQSIYPHISSVANKSKEDAIGFIKKIAIYMMLFTLFLSVLLLFAAGFILTILAGPQYYSSIIVLQILSFIPLMVGLSNIFGIQTMLTFNYKRAFSSITIVSSLLNIILALILVPIYQEIGTSVAFLVTETLVTSSMYFYLRKKGIKLITIIDINEALKFIKNH